MSVQEYDPIGTANLTLLLGKVGRPMTIDGIDSHYYYTKNSETDLPKLPDDIAIGKVANFVLKGELLDMHTKIVMLGESASIMPTVRGQGQLAGDIWFDIRQSDTPAPEDEYAHIDISIDVATNGALAVVDANAAYWHPNALGLDDARDVLKIFGLPDLTEPVPEKKYQYRDVQDILLSPSQSDSAARFILDIVSQSELQR